MLDRSIARSLARSHHSPIVRAFARSLAHSLARYNHGICLYYGPTTRLYYDHNTCMIHMFTIVHVNLIQTCCVFSQPENDSNPTTMRELPRADVGSLEHIIGMLDKKIFTSCSPRRCPLHSTDAQRRFQTAWYAPKTLPEKVTLARVSHYSNLIIGA